MRSYAGQLPYVAGHYSGATLVMIWLPGEHVTATSSKRDTGTAYTPCSLAEQVAKHALDPLIYEPDLHSEPDEAKAKPVSAVQLLSLKTATLRLDQRAILVAAARYLAEALLQSRIDFDELPADALATAASDTESLDVRVGARRDIVSSCVYESQIVT